MIFPKYYIGPMSVNVVDCVIKHSHIHPIGLIPSRRQVDYCGGYVNNWDTRSLSQYVSNENVLLCRDHGGPYQGLNNDYGVRSFICDCDNLNLIHIDPFKNISSISDAAKLTVHFLKICFLKNSKILYEVGTEEAIFKYEPEHLNEFLTYLKDNLKVEEFSQIKYAVIQSGTRLDLPTRTNIGNFNNGRLLNFIEVVKKFGLMSKEHNGDYLIDSFDVESRYASGLDAINIAPEFGQIESEFYIEQCKNTCLFDILYDMCYSSGRWKKWVLDETRVSKEQIIMTCCHYILSKNEFIEKIKINFPNSDKLIQKRIDSKLKLLNEQTKNYCI
jgi:hypothetical protein